MTCPLSLVTNLFLIGVAIYSVLHKNYTILIFALGVLCVLLVSKKEGYQKLSMDPEDTGIVRPLWGPLYPVASKAQKEHHYYTMRGLPWSSPPLEPTAFGSKIARERTPEKIEIPYSQDKI